MRRTKLYKTVALLASAFASSSTVVHAQATRDIHPVKPMMMLLVDTSGSMERMPDTSGCVDCMPTCKNTVADEGQKNRWAVTLEALTGSFDGFRCKQEDRLTYAKTEFDYGYFLPHYAQSYTKQQEDGVLDAYKSRIKFGLMTFDGVLTTVTGDTLVSYSDYGSVSKLRDDIDGRPGMYSYPTVQAGADNSGFGWKKVFFPGCLTPYGVNAGARGKAPDSDPDLPGSLISVGADDGATAVNTINQRIQESLLKVRPYGGTPIPAMLDDFRYYLQKDDDVSVPKYTGDKLISGDAYHQCRRRFAVLLTDGAPDALFRGEPFKCDRGDEGKGECKDGADCTCPYERAESIAAKLIKEDKLEKLWVVAFNVNDPVAIAQLDKIAAAGRTDKAVPALSPTALKTELERLMQLAQPEATSRSVPVVVNTGSVVSLGGKQFEISAGFVVGDGDDQPWEGRLYRRRIGCDGADVTDFALDEDKGDLFHVTLNEQTSRKLYTVAPETDQVRGTLLNGAKMSATGVNLLTTNTVHPVSGSQFTTYLQSDLGDTDQSKVRSNAIALTAFDKNVNPAYFRTADGNSVHGEASDRNVIHDYVHGISSLRATRKLGDIYHSNPVVLPPLTADSEELDSSDQLLRSYYQSLLEGTTAPYGVKGRPGVVFVASNDGLLHAFNLDTWNDKSGGTQVEAGHELWGFTPPILFKKMASMALPTHQDMFDGTPVVRDVVLSRPVPSGEAVLSTVLVIGVRGEPAYVALDVKQPENPKFLWQRSFAHLGYTVATPAIAHVKLKVGLGEQIRAVAILPGGEGTIDDQAPASCLVDQYGRGLPPSGRTKVPCWKARGRSLYVVDIASGELIQEFDGRHFPSPMTGAVAVDSQGVALTRAAYMSDEDGVLWRLSMNSSDPSKWRVAPIHDLYAGDALNLSGATVSIPAADAYKAGRPAIYPPLVSRDAKTGNVTIVMGTGDVDALFDTVAHRVVSLTEVRKLEGGELTTGNMTVNWKLQLEAGESVTGPLNLLDESVFFTSFKGPARTDDPCEIGQSRILGAHVRNVHPSTKLPLGQLYSAQSKSYVLYEHPYDGASSAQTTMKSLLLGVSVARDPVCVVGTTTFDPVTGMRRVQQTGAASGGDFRLRSMVAGNGGQPMPGSASGSNGGQRQFTQKVPVSRTARSVSWASSIE